ncbi:hypothetical protein AAG747_08920 [Rapidithrix thailandica]|uniref:Uncharacterized protein n=1 Tax=Rapidithrix thailandica TaxID=413964 RepID=A0AAW9S8F0_9BACT
MDLRDDLFQSFGELLYVIFNQDNGISDHQFQGIRQTLQQVSWGEEVYWSFQYEAQHHPEPEKLFYQVLDAFSQFGPQETYAPFFTLILHLIHQSESSDLKEQRLKKFERFRFLIMERFQNDQNIK